MGFFDFLRRRESTVTDSTTSTASTGGTYKNRIISVFKEEQALRVAAVFRAVEVKSSTAAELPLQYMRRNNALDYFEPYMTGAGAPLFYALTVRPNSRMTAYSLIKQIVWDREMYGNSYALPVYNESGELDEILYLGQNVDYDKLTNLYNVHDPVNNIYGVYTADEILHFKNISVDGGYTGVSTLHYAALNMSIAATGENETLDRIGTGGRYKAIYTNDNSVRGFGQYQDKALKANGDDIQKQIDEGKDIITVRGDGKLQQMSMSSADMQFLQSKEFNLREIARFFQVPASKLFIDSNSNYNSVEMSNLEFYTGTMMPILTMIENELNAKLIRRSVYNKYKFKFNTDKLFTTDLNAEANYYDKLIGNAIMTVNEVRKAKNLPPVKGGDKPFISTNMAAIDNAKVAGEGESGQPQTDSSSD